ncbi:xanthine dehydrogenase family protein molybdopterin-binding subunit [Acidiferrobacter sp.]
MPNRREFFKIVGTGAGLLLALDTRAAGAHQGMRSARPELRTFAPNAWVRIGSDDQIVIVVDKSEMGQGPLTTLPMLVAEELDADWDRLRIEQAPTARAYINPALGAEATGGSSSVRSSYLPLRTAGATTRLMLLQAAHRRTGIAYARLRTARGAVLLPDGQRLSYGALADAAAQLPVPRHVRLKSPRRFQIIGRPLPRLDTPAKITGSAVFGIDVQRPGLLIGVVRRPPMIGGHLLHYDDHVARAMAGVVRVARIDQGLGVIATDTWTAWKALDAIPMRWKDGDGARTSTRAIREGYRRAAGTEAAIAERRGDVRATLRRAPRVIAADYEIPFAAHAPLEPMNCTAHIHDGLCEISAPTQAQTGAQAIAAHLTGLPLDRVVVHTTLLGGGFGRRLEHDFIADAVTLARMVPQPVKVVWSREEDMTHDFYRPYSYHRVQGALDSHGMPIAWRQTIVAASLMRTRDPSAIKRGVDQTAVGGAVGMPYSIPNIEIGYVERDPKVPVGFWRSVADSYTAFVKESFLDELAHAAGRDPLALRYALLASEPAQRRVLKAAARAIGWDRPHARDQGLGVAVHRSFGTSMAQAASVNIRSGKLHIDRLVCVCDCGLVVNPNIARAQIEGAIVFGLQAALKGPITVEDSRIQQDNFDSYPLLRMDEMPRIDVHFLKNVRAPQGLGEPAVPPVAPALANAIFAASGIRVRTLPFPAIPSHA